MVPVEPISLSIGIATLFTTCIECFEYFKAAKGFRQNYGVLLVKLEYQQERLLVWGDLAGVGDEKQQSVGLISENTETLKSKYGLRAYTPATDSVPHSGITSNALKRFRLRVGRHSQGTSVLGKTRWAIHDETKFQKLVQDIRELIDGLMTGVPVSPELQEQKVQDDIASMVDDIQSLHLFQEACKDDYPKCWTATSAAIDASDVATLDNRLVDERLEHYGTFNHDGKSPSINVPLMPSHFGDQKIHLDGQIFFALTESYRAQGSETACDQNSIVFTSFQKKNSFIAPGSNQTRSAPGYRFTKYIKTGRWDDDENDRRPPGMAYIFCPPCACQIATAFDICVHRNKTHLVRACVRIDPRLKTSCSASVSGIERLNSFIEYIKEMERLPWQGDKTTNDLLKWIDREWLEQCVWEYTEEDLLIPVPPESRLVQTAEFHKDEWSCTAIIILGEADYCIPLMGARPFPPLEPWRLPRENQLFRNWQTYDKSSKQYYWERKFIGTYTPKDPFPPKRPAPADSDSSQTLGSAQHDFKRARSSTWDYEGSWT